MKFPRLIGLLSLLAAQSFAEGLPDLGEAAQATLSVQQERRVGESIMQQIHADPAYLDDPELTEYLNNLGYRLVSNSPDNQRDFEFFLVQDRTLNAFALPGGFIGVNTGLIQAAQSESELAGVLAHEIAHVTQHHLSRMLAGTQQSTLTSMAALAVAILAARSNPEVAQAAIATAQAASIQSQLNFTREHEREADRIGFQILQQSGFDTRGMASFFERLQKFGRLYDNDAPAYLRTHPLTTERIADIENRVASAPYRQVPDNLEFQMLRAKLRSAQDTPEQAVAAFEEMLRERTGNPLAAHYGLVLGLQRTGNRQRAEQELAALRKAAPPQAMIENLSAQLAMTNGQAGTALERYLTALKRFPHHRALIYGYAETLLQNRQAPEATTFLDKQLQTRPTDYHLYQLQAKSYAAQGKTLLQHKAQAEAYARSGNISGAIEQLQLAQKSEDGDFYQQSIVEARLRELRAIDMETRKKRDSPN
jgi:predicted Zn-dependent protease